MESNHMYKMKCKKCGKNFFCTKSNFWHNCKKERNLCVCFECWFLSFKENRNKMILSNQDYLKVKKILDEIKLCYGEEIIALEKL
jgi:hypothetical protein